MAYVSWTIKQSNNKFNYSSHLELRFFSIQPVTIRSLVLISYVDKKRIDCSKEKNMP